MGAKFDQFVELLDVTAGTSDQTSGEFRRPSGAKSLIIAVNVTAGAVLLLDVHLEYFNEGVDGWKAVINNVPGLGSITGISTTHVVFGPHGLTADSDLLADMAYRNIPLFVKNRIKIDHGNATAATYKVWAQWR